MQAFPHAKIIIRHVLVLVQEGKLACTSFPPWWNDVVRDALVLLQDGKLACASCPPCWNDVISRCNCARWKSYHIE
jgi:hypothetical protein